jgi:hypothetical protein
MRVDYVDPRSQTFQLCLEDYIDVIVFYHLLNRAGGEILVIKDVRWQFKSAGSTRSKKLSRVKLTVSIEPKRV